MTRLDRTPDPRPFQSPAELGTDSHSLASAESSPLLDTAARRRHNLRTGGSSREHDWRGIEDLDRLPWWRTPSVFWLLAPFALFALAFGGIVVPKVNLILELVCRRYLAEQAITETTPLHSLASENPQCRIPEVQERVATLMLVINLVAGLLSAYVAPKFGRLSDGYGRKRLLALASCGGLVAEFITILAAKFPDSVDYNWLILGAAFDGLTGSFTAGNLLCQSYTSDCTPPSKRAVSIGYIHACLFAGLAVGPLLSGYFVKWTGSLLSIFYLVLGCHTFFVLFVGFVVPESVSKKKQLAARERWRIERERRAKETGSSWRTTLRRSNPLLPLVTLWPTGRGTSTRLRLNLVALAICDTVIMGGTMAASAVTILYSGYMFGWGNLESSRFVSAVSMMRVVVLMGIFPLLNYLGRVRPAARLRKISGVAAPERNAGADGLDTWLLLIAILSEVVGCVGYVLAPSPAAFFVSGLLTAFGGLGSATAQAVVTKHVPAERVGQVLGAIGTLHALTRVVGPVVFNGIYAATVKVFPQAVFVAIGSLFAFALLCSCVIKPHVHWEDGEEAEEAATNDERNGEDEEQEEEEEEAEEAGASLLVSARRPFEADAIL